MRAQVCKAKYSQLSLAASLAAGLCRYHSGLGVGLVDSLLEEVRVGMEQHATPTDPGPQRRLAQMRLLGELYNYRLVDSKVRGGRKIAALEAAPRPAGGWLVPRRV